LPEGLSTEDVSGAINTALEGLENLSSDDVDTAITNALDNINNLSSEDVESIVDTAVENVSDDVGDLTDVIGTAGVVDDPDTDVDETQDPTGLFATIKTYEDAGLDRDEALQKAIGDVAGALNTTKTDLLSAVGETETSLVEQITDAETNLEKTIIEGDETLAERITGIETNLGVDIDTVADLIGKPAREVTETDVDFVIDLIAQENVSAELTAQYDVTGDGLVDINDQNMLMDNLQGNDVAFADTSMFNPATGMYAEMDANTDAITDMITNMNTNINAQVNQQNLRDLVSMEQQGLFKGAKTTVSSADPMNIDYLYDFNSVFANPSQEGLFASPYSTTTRNKAANQSTQPMPMASGFAEGGQVEDENDILLRLLGET